MTKHADYIPTHLTHAIRSSWARLTAAPAQAKEWRSGNPASGHSLITALTLQNELGGELVTMEAHHRDLPAPVAHFRNHFLPLTKLDDGDKPRVFDLSAEQFPHRTAFIPVHPGTQEHARQLQAGLFDDNTLPDRLDRFFNQLTKNGYQPRCGAGIAIMSARARYGFAVPPAQMA